MADITLLEKSKKDPYFKSATKRWHNVDVLLKAGFFDDGLENPLGTLGSQVKWHCTPLDIIRSNLEKSHLGQPIVLLTAGGLAPPHIGHISMMDTARQQAEQEGWHVLGGFLSPSHDSYVSTKHPNALTGAERVELSRRLCATTDWLAVEPWEALYIDKAVNFTDVILHLKRVLTHWFEKPIEVGFVYGSDNAYFSRAFLKMGYGICVERQGHAKAWEVTRDEATSLNSKVMFAPSHPHGGLSSSIVRANALMASEKDVENQENIKNVFQENVENQENVKNIFQYIVRDEGLAPIESWLTDANRTQLLDAREVLVKTLTREIANCFPQSANLFVESYPEVVVRLVTTQSVQEDTKTISMDQYTPADYRLDVSRCFELSGYQGKSKSLVARPGFKEISEQIKEIPAGSYVLIEDDIASGSTIRKVETMLKTNGVEICKKVLLLADVTIEQDVHDVVDIRDFLVGSQDGGLVVSHMGVIGRVPYMAPYVDLTTRAKIHPNCTRGFSIALWKANLEFHRRSNLKISDANAGFQAIMVSLGWPSNTLLSDFCQYHLDVLL